MGLFSKKNAPEPKPEQKTEPVPKKEPVIEHHKEVDVVFANLTENMLKVELEKDAAYFDAPKLSMVADKIRISGQGIIIAEVGKRGKAFKELEPYVGKTAESISITAKSGEYGDYYKIRLAYETNVATITID